jgi:hypothetical protein
VRFTAVTSVDPGPGLDFVVWLGSHALALFLLLGRREGMWCPFGCSRCGPPPAGEGPRRGLALGGLLDLLGRLLHAGAHLLAMLLGGLLG